MLEEKWIRLETRVIENSLTLKNNNLFSLYKIVIFKISISRINLSTIIVGLEYQIYIYLK